MRILFVAFPDSIHTARWIGQIVDQGWDIHLFPSTLSGDPHFNLEGVKLHTPKIIMSILYLIEGFIRHVPFEFMKRPLQNRLYENGIFVFHTIWLLLTIRFLKPDVVHSLEIQHAGYLTLNAKSRLRSKFPLWIVTNWGSDIYLFGRLAKHRSIIQAVLRSCDYYWCECNRDVRLARDWGFTGEIYPVIPNTGGFDLQSMHKLRTTEVASSRKLILLKGYQNFAGRALVGVRAIELCADVIREGGYSVVIYSCSDDVSIAAELVSQSTCINIRILQQCSHIDILKLFAQARVYIGLSISDGISTSLLEAMMMGVFPIQSFTACADEWIEDQRTGFLVEPEDPIQVASALRIALTDDALVNVATEQNIKISSERLDYRVISSIVRQTYQELERQITDSRGSC